MTIYEIIMLIIALVSLYHQLEDKHL